MPLNPLWLEHTEKAAWDTIQTLRRQIETERARVADLMRLQKNQPRLLEALASARATHAIVETDAAVVIEYLSRELEQARRACTELAEQVRDERAARERDSLRLLADLETPAMSVDASHAASLEDFFRLVRERAERTSAKSLASYDRLLDALEKKLDDLEQAPRREIAGHAAEVARLAFCIAAKAGRRRSASASDE